MFLFFCFVFFHIGLEHFVTSQNIGCKDYREIECDRKRENVMKVLHIYNHKSLTYNTISKF